MLQSCCPFDAGFEAPEACDVVVRHRWTLGDWGHGVPMISVSSPLEQLKILQ